MYTRCPNCNSQFEITQEYLDIANGKVRCGNCEHIFNALDNLFEAPPEEQTAAEETAEPEAQFEEPGHNDTGLSPANIVQHAKESPVTDTGLDDKPLSTPSIDIKAKMEKIAASLSAATQELKSARKSSIFDDQADDGQVADKSVVDDQPLIKAAATEESLTMEDTAVAEPATVDESFVTESSPAEDESTATEPLATDESAEAIESLTADEVTETETVEEEFDIIDFQDRQEEESYSQSVTDYSTKKVDQDDIDILKSLINEPEAQGTPSEEGLLSELDNINHALSADAESIDSEFSDSTDEFNDMDTGDDLLAELEQLEKQFSSNDQAVEDISLDEEFSGPGELDAQAVSVEDTFSETQISSINDEAFESESSTEPGPVTQASEKVNEDEVVPSFLTQAGSGESNPKAMFAWLAGTIALVFVLAAQYLHVNSSALSQNTTFRPLLESLCPMTGCTLPLRKSPRKIITVTHDVRTHPSVNNALEIQLTFKNKANFTQGYPLLEIIFSNSRGELVARRKFTPEEYLSADIQYIHGLKTNQTQDVRLKIVDPDPSSLLSFQFNYY